MEIAKNGNGKWRRAYKKKEKGNRIGDENGRRRNGGLYKWNRVKQNDEVKYCAIEKWKIRRKGQLWTRRGNGAIERTGRRFDFESPRSK